MPSGLRAVPLFDSPGSLVISDVAERNATCDALPARVVASGMLQPENRMLISMRSIQSSTCEGSPEDEGIRMPCRGIPRRTRPTGGGATTGPQRAPCPAKIHPSRSQYRTVPWRRAADVQRNPEVAVIFAGVRYHVRLRRSKTRTWSSSVRRTL